MDFTLIESLNVIGHDIDYSVQCIKESLENHVDRDIIIESADGVLGQLASKLKSGPLRPEEIDEYAQLYASLSMLAKDAVRQGLNINMSTPIGKQKFANVVNNVGTVPGMTNQVKRVATVNGNALYTQTKRDLANFASMDDQHKQQYINQINKLRIGYERVKNQLSAQSNAMSQNKSTQTGGNTNGNTNTNSNSFGTSQPTNNSGNVNSAGTNNTGGSTTGFPTTGSTN